MLIIHRHINHALLAGCVALLISACSSHPDPIIDTKGVDMTQYDTDLAECRGYSEQIDPSTGVAKGAAGGGATGAAVGAIAKGGNVGSSAGIGAVLGGVRSGVKASDDKEDVVKRCLRGRGYKVLN